MERLESEHLEDQEVERALNEIRRFTHGLISLTERSIHRLPSVIKRSRIYWRAKLRIARPSSSKTSKTVINFIAARRRWLCPARLRSLRAPPLAWTALNSKAIMPTPALSM